MREKNARTILLLAEAVMENDCIAPGGLPVKHGLSSAAIRSRALESAQTTRTALQVATKSSSSFGVIFSSKTLNSSLSENGVAHKFTDVRRRAACST